MSQQLPGPRTASPAFGAGPGHPAAADRRPLSDPDDPPRAPRPPVSQDDPGRTLRARRRRHVPRRDPTPWPDRSHAGGRPVRGKAPRRADPPRPPAARVTVRRRPERELKRRFRSGHLRREGDVGRSSPGGNALVDEPPGTAEVISPKRPPGTRPAPRRNATPDPRMTGEAAAAPRAPTVRPRPDRQQSRRARRLELQTSQPRRGVTPGWPIAQSEETPDAAKPSLPLDGRGRYRDRRAEMQIERVKREDTRQTAPSASRVDAARGELFRYPSGRGVQSRLDRLRCNQRGSGHVTIRTVVP